MIPVELVVALRFLREGRSQTLLIFVGAALGVAVVLFLTALLDGLERSLLEKTLSAQAHVVVEGLRDEPEPARPTAQGERVHRRVDPGLTRAAVLRDAGPLVARLDRLPAVRAVSPVAATSAFALRGALRESISLQGVDRERHEAIVPLRERVVRGRVDLSGDRAVVGAGVAEALGLDVGDPFRVLGPLGVDGTFRVAGIVRFGAAAADDRWVFVSVRRAQTLGGLGDEYTRIDVQLHDANDAIDVADSLRGRVDASVASWQERNPDLLSGIRAQASSGLVINVFVALAVALGIASVLVVSVVQRRGEIGVLRATGTHASTVLRIFLWQGVLVGLVGSLLGTVVGVLLIDTFVTFVRDENGDALFPIVVTARLVGQASLLAMATGLVAAFAPARSAAALDPVEAIRGR